MLTLASKANNTKNVIASVSDDAVMRTIHHLVDICLRFQLYLPSSVWSSSLCFGTMTSGPQYRRKMPICLVFLGLDSLLPRPSRGHRLHLVRPFQLPLRTSQLHLRASQLPRDLPSSVRGSPSFLSDPFSSIRSLSKSHRRPPCFFQATPS